MIPPYTVKPDPKLRITRDEAWKMFLEGKGTSEDPGLWYTDYHMSPERLGVFMARHTDWPPGFEPTKVRGDDPESPRALALHGPVEHGMMKVPGIHDGGAFYAIAQAIPRSWRIALLGNLWAPYCMRASESYGAGSPRRFHHLTARTLHMWLITEWVGLWQRLDREDVSEVELGAEGLFGLGPKYWDVVCRPGADQSEMDFVGRQVRSEVLGRQPKADQYLWRRPHDNWDFGSMVIQKALVFENQPKFDRFVREHGLHHQVVKTLGIRERDVAGFWGRIPKEPAGTMFRWVVHRIEDRQMETRPEVAATALIAREYARVVEGRGWAYDSPKAIALLKAVDLVAITGFCHLLARRMRMGTSWIFPPEDAPVVPGWDPLGMKEKRSSLERVDAAP